MTRLIPVDGVEAILPAYRGTPIERLLRHHNLGQEQPRTDRRAELLISMCMDHRKYLMLPTEFAFVLRSAGGNLQGREFELSFAIAVGGVRTIALLAHTDCRMTRVTGMRDAFVSGLVERGGWAADDAAAQFDRHAERYEIGDAVEFVCSEVDRLRRLYPGVQVAPLLYRVEDDRLVQIAGPDGSPR